MSAIVTTTARDLQDQIVDLIKSDDLPAALTLARQGLDRFPTETLAGGFKFQGLIDGLTAALRPVNRPVSAAPAAPVSAPVAAPVSAAPAARKARGRKAPAAAPVSAAPVIPVSGAPVSAAPVGNVVTIEYHPQHGTISRGEIGSDVFAELGWGYARKLGWHYLGDRGKSVADSAETINFAMQQLAAAGFDVRTSITGAEQPEAKPQAPATARKRGTRKTFGTAPVSAAPVSAPAAPVSAAPVSAPAARKARKAPVAAPVSAPAAPVADDTLTAILAAIREQGAAIAALQSGTAAPVSVAPVSVAPVSVPVAAPVDVDDIDDDSAEDIMARVMLEIAPKRTQEAAALAWRFVIRDGANAKHTASDLRSRLAAEVGGYYTDNRIGSVGFTVMRIGGELMVTVKSATGDIVPSKLRAQVQGIGLTTRGIDRSATVKAASK